MFALLALFAAGVAYDAMLLKKDKDALAKLNRSMRQYDESLSTDPTQPSIDASKKNIKELEKHLLDLEKDLTRESEHIFKPLTADEGFQLREVLARHGKHMARGSQEARHIRARRHGFRLQKVCRPQRRLPERRRFAGYLEAGLRSRLHQPEALQLQVAGIAHVDYQCAEGDSSGRRA